MRGLRRALLAFGVAAAPVAGPAFAISARADEALTVPPELRPGGAPATTPSPVPAAKPAGKPAAKGKAASKAPSAAVARPLAEGAAAPPSPRATPPSLAAPRPKAEDDPVSFGLKWSADNQPNRGAATTDGLIEEYNKTLNNQSLGSGGAVGFKYKF